MTIKSNTPLRFAEEIVLLLLNDDGTFVPAPSHSVDYALAGGVLMDLALENRIDTDLERLFLIDSTPTGDELLDPTLRAIDESDDGDARFWVERVAENAGSIKSTSIKRLVDRGILEREDERILWVFRSRRYPTVDGTAQREVKLRILEVLFSDEIPDPRDIVIIALAHACGIFKQVLTNRELERVADRIDQVRRMDLIGQAMTQAIQEIELSIASAMQRYTY